MAIVKFEFSPEKLPHDAQRVSAAHFDQWFKYRTPWDQRQAEGVSPYEGLEMAGPHGLWLYETHIGLCLRDYERNGYDDSDFHMVVWNPEKGAPEDICFASTRGWSYPAYNSYVDATEEVVEAHRAYCERKERASREAEESHRRASEAARKSELKLLASRYGTTSTRLEGLDQRVLKLLKANVRSGFKKSLREQVVSWLQQDRPKYASPLSERQMGYL